MHILITGANGGMGMALAERFLAESEPEEHHLWLGVRSRRDRVEALVEKHGERCRLVPLEVTRESDWTDAMEAMAAVGQSPDVLINNAGFHLDGLLATMSLEDWNAVIRANLDAVYLGCHAVIKSMMAKRFGRIINVSSLSALLAPRGQTNYAAAKAGVVALTQSLAKETARAGITVNALCPGYIDTEALADLPEAERRGLLSTIPMRRLGKPSEVAAAAAFLASADAAYITGAAIKIDGGIL